MRIQSLAFALVSALVAGAAIAAPSDDTSHPRAVGFRCEGDQCGAGSASGPSADALLRECEQVVSVLGPVSRYQSRGRELSAHDLAQCNRRATRTPVAGG